MEIDNSYGAETEVLGSIIKSPELMDSCFLSPEEFGDDRHRLIMKFLQHLHADNIPVDLTSICREAGKDVDKIGGPAYLLELRGTVITTINFDYHQSVVREAYIERRTAQEMQAMVREVYTGDGDIKGKLAKGQAKLEELVELANKSLGGGLRRMGGALEGHVELLRERKKKKGVTGTRTLSKDLNRITGGHQPTDLEVIAARPSMGKTACMICDALAAAQDGAASVIFSGEMPDLQITERAICALANLDNSKMRTGMFDDSDWDRYSFARTQLEQLPIYIDDTPGMTIQHIRKEVKKMIKVHPKMIVYVDYLQLIGGGRRFDSRREEVNYISKQLKSIARVYNVTVVALAQLSRDVEKRQDKRPMMSDLGESGAIEQDADIITFLYRDDYYDKESEKKNIVEIILAKGRNVGTGVVEMAFLKNIGKFAEIDQSQK
ncbi:replicative DNA helicase [Paenibacillus sp. 598K]|uniref:replicative DNA helicase n=1 Tax=Paenibacillus sp. 598K TaxID=1117987 RepID=UPI000FF9AC74|nr:replicative DNA helicase [Paenibacillus sp. 598K]GBF73162.1 replicative DNA helicase [Paenibacillus sp. 598K]